MLQYRRKPGQRVIVEIAGIRIVIEMIDTSSRCATLGFRVVGGEVDIYREEAGKRTNLNNPTSGEPP